MQERLLEVAKAKYGGDFKKVMAYKKACKKAYKATHKRKKLFKNGLQGRLEPAFPRRFRDSRRPGGSLSYSRFLRIPAWAMQRHAAPVLANKPAQARL